MAIFLQKNFQKQKSNNCSTIFVLQNGAGAFNLFQKELDFNDRLFQYVFVPINAKADHLRMRSLIF